MDHEDNKLLDDKLLDDIGQRARERDAEDQQRFDERWRQLAAGTISEADDDALRALAETSEEARLDYKALRPLEPPFHERIARQWQAATPTPISNPRWRWTSASPWLAAAATLAVAVAGWQYWLGPDGSASPALPTLPEYRAELSGATSQIRSHQNDSRPPVFDRGNVFQLLLRPAEAVGEASVQDALSVERRFFLEGSNQELEHWSVDLSLSRGGSLEIEGIVGQDLALGPDDRALVFIYGHPGRLPDSTTLNTVDQLATAAQETTDWRYVRIPFQVKDGLPGPALEVEVAGCRAFTTARGCVPGKELTLWVGAPEPTRFAVRLGGRRVDDAGTEVDGGRQFKIEASPEDGEIEVRGTLGGVTMWRLPLDRAHDLPQWLLDAQRLFSEGEIEAAQREIENHLETAEPIAEAVALGTLARLLMRNDAPYEEILKPLEDAIKLHTQSGELVHLTRDLGMAIFIDIQLQDVSVALDRLERLASALQPAAPAEAKIFQLNYQAMLERRLGSFRHALDIVQREVTLAQRLGLTAKHAQASELKALILQDLGHFAEADALLRELETVYAERPCQLMRVLNNRAWGLIRAADPELGVPWPLHVRALEIAEQESCGTTGLTDVLLDQARVLVDQRETSTEQEGQQPGEQTSREVDRILQRVHGLIERATPTQLLWREHIEGLKKLQDGEVAKALEHFQNLEQRSLETAFAEGQWLAKVSQAKAYRVLGDSQAIMVELEAADVMLDSHSLQIPLHAGRERFLAHREEGTQIHLEILLDTGRAADALTVARRSRSRLLRGAHLSHRLHRLSREQHQEWQSAITEYLKVRAEVEAAAAKHRGLASDQLSPARESQTRRLDTALDRAMQVLDRGIEVPDLPPIGDEVLLVYHPLAEGWVGFGAFADEVVSHRFKITNDSINDPESLTQLLLKPFRDLLPEGREVRILPFGQLHEVDFHALPWDGDVFLAAHPVVYGLDLSKPPATSPTLRTLVVSDPLGDLPAALVEGEAVADALDASAPVREVHRLTGAKATRAELSDLLGIQSDRFDLLHYAGHGAFENQAALGGSLVLAGPSRLTLGDVLALGDRAPTEVVLSSCESARTESRGVANLGLAQAFVAAGSHRVVAATRPVGDQATAEFFRQLYGDGSSLGLAEAFRRAQLAWRQRNPTEDWASFRLLEP